MGLFLLAAALLTAGSIVLGVIVFAPGYAELLQKATSPVVSPAPEPVKKDAVPEPAIVTVPQIPEGASKKAAGKLLANKGLELGEVKKKASDEVEKGGVISQDPKPKSSVEKGSSVGITLSSGPKKPDPTAGGIPPSTDLYLTVPKMGLQDDYVANGVDPTTLMNGAGHSPSSGFPWQPRSNTYIASHVLGYAGTGSYLHFAQLPNMAYGDNIFLKDGNGTTYTYEVTEILQVSIYDTWVMGPTGKDIVSLQTCINPPAYDIRLVVRGDLKNVETA